MGGGTCLKVQWGSWTMLGAGGTGQGKEEATKECTKAAFQTIPAETLENVNKSPDISCRVGYEIDRNS